MENSRKRYIVIHINREMRYLGSFQIQSVMKFPPIINWTPVELFSTETTLRYYGAYDKFNAAIIKLLD